MICRPRTLTVEARQWTGGNASEMAEWLDYALVRANGSYIVIENRCGCVCARTGDYVVHDGDGFWPLAESEFHRLYEVEDEAAGGNGRRRKGAK